MYYYEIENGVDSFEESWQPHHLTPYTLIILSSYLLTSPDLGRRSRGIRFKNERLELRIFDLQIYPESRKYGYKWFCFLLHAMILVYMLNYSLKSKKDKTAILVDAKAIVLILNTLL